MKFDGNENFTGTEKCPSMFKISKNNTHINNNKIPLFEIGR